MSARTNPLASNEVLIYGDTGVLRIDLARQVIELGGPGGPWAPVEIRDDERAEWTAEIDFIAAIRGERPVTLTDLATAAHYMAVVEAIDRSARRRPPNPGPSIAR